MISRDCVVCGSGRKQVVYAAALPEEPYTPGFIHAAHDEPGTARWWRYRVVCCRECGHYYADPVLDPDAVGASYLAQDHDNHFGVDENILLRTHRGYADLVRPRLPTRRDLQVDIGCDTGCFLKASRDFGFTRVVGVEPGKLAAECATMIPNVTIMNKLFDPSDFNHSSIQLLSMIHVLDHLPEPVSFMRSIVPLMDHDGVVLAVVHNVKSVLARLSGKRWAPISVMHFDYYSSDTLMRVFAGAGFKSTTVIRTKNYFPLFHLVRFAPGLSLSLRRVLYRVTSGPVFRRVVVKLPLGNIAIIARV